jgi:integrase
MTNRRHFGSVRRLPSGRYQACYWHEGQRRAAPHTFARKADAQGWLSVTETSILRGEWINPAAGKTTFREYAEAWRAVQVHRPRTSAQLETNLRLHVYPRLGSRPIAAIRTSQIQALVKAMSTGDEAGKALSPGTVALIQTWLNTIFRAAVKDRAIASSPCDGIRRPTVHKAKVTPLPVETVEALIEAVPDRYRALIVLGAGTGVRISEALGLTADRVDWMRRNITVDRQLAGAGGGVPTFGPVKDRKNRPRTIPLPRFVVDELAAHVAKYGLGPEGLLFAGPRGGAIGTTVFYNMWRGTAGPLGIPTGDGFHLLRHFYASLLIRAGESVKVVQERLGHASAVMTLDVYGHMWPGDDDRTRDAVDDVLGLRAHSAHAAGE